MTKVTGFVDRHHLFRTASGGNLHHKLQPMNINITNTERSVRIFTAMVLFMFYFGYNSIPSLGYLALVTGILLMITNFTGFCPLYWLAGKKGINEGVTVNIKPDHKI